MNYSSTLFVILIFVCDMWRKYLIIFKGNNWILFHKSKVCLDSTLKEEFHLL
jgi:hypothetical protein